MMRSWRPAATAIHRRGWLLTGLLLAGAGGCGETFDYVAGGSPTGDQQAGAAATDPTDPAETAPDPAGESTGGPAAPVEEPPQPEPIAPGVVTDFPESIETRPPDPQPEDASPGPEEASGPSRDYSIDDLFGPTEREIRESATPETDLEPDQQDAEPPPVQSSGLVPPTPADPPAPRGADTPTETAEPPPTSEEGFDDLFAELLGPAAEEAAAERDRNTGNALAPETPGGALPAPQPGVAAEPEPFGGLPDLGPGDAAESLPTPPHPVDPVPGDLFPGDPVAAEPLIEAPLPAVPIDIGNTRHLAWLLGSKASWARLERIVDMPMPDDLGEQVAALAESLGVELPFGAGATTDAALVSRLLNDTSSLADQLARRHGADHAAIVEVAVKTNLLIAVYDKNPALAGPIARSVTAAAERAGLEPGAVGAMQGVLAGAPSTDEVVSAVFDLHDTIERSLRTPAP